MKQNSNFHNITKKHKDFLFDLLAEVLSDKTTNIKQTEMLIKTGQAIVRLVEMLDEMEKRQKQNMDKERGKTPYDQIPPPCKEEMQIIDARLERIFNSLRRAAIADGLYEGIDPKRKNICVEQLENTATRISKMPR